MAKSEKTRSKFPALITYIIAVVFLVAGLIFPITVKAFTQGIDFGNMPVLQLTGALAALKILNGPLPFGVAITPAYSFAFSVGGISFDPGAALLLAYALVTVVALILLIPACIAKKRGKVARRLILVGELLALTVLLVMSALEFARNNGDLNLSIVVPFGVTLLMLVIQCMVYIGKSGVIKFILFLLSVINLLALTNVVADLHFLAAPLNNLATALKGSRPFETTTGLFSVDGQMITGGTILHELLADPKSVLAGGNVGMMITNFLVLGLCALVAGNLYLDMLGLGKRTNKFMLVMNLIRYLLQFAIIVALIISVFTVMGSFGLMMYLLTIVSIIQLTIQSVRLGTYKKPAAAEETDAVANNADRDDEYAFDSETPVTTQEVQVPTEAANTQNQNVYTVNPIYNGPTDNFINKLTNEQKIEFAQVFLERRSGNLSVIPSYIVGGDNSKFFSYVFIYLARVREVVSDGLMNKMYDEVNLLSA